jgi:hypothetical protein
MANMTAVAQKLGHSSKAFIVLPLVSAFFIDLLNAVLITFSSEQGVAFPPCVSRLMSSSIVIVALALLHQHRLAFRGAAARVVDQQVD